MKLTLSVFHPAKANGPVYSITLNEQGATLGRSHDNTLVLPDPNRYVSKHHVLIEYRQPHYYLTDTSSNGVFVNNSRKPLGQGNSIRLKDGDRFAVGEYTVKVTFDEASGQSDTPGSPDQTDSGSFPLEDWFADETSVDATHRQKQPVDVDVYPTPSSPVRSSAREDFPLSGKTVRQTDFGEAKKAPSGKRLHSVDSRRAESIIRHGGFARASRVSDRTDRSVLGDIVDCSVFAPPRVNLRIDRRFIVQVFIHLSEQENRVRSLAKEFDEAAERRGRRTLETQIEFGARLTFHLLMPELEVASPLQTLTWFGKPDAVQFPVNIPGGATGGKRIGTVTVSQDSVPIGQISFTLALVANEISAPADLAGEAKIYRKAFISYASSDRNEVLKRVQMLSRLHIDFFQDLLSLEPGQQWESEIYRRIDESDVFFLFWSTAAKASRWVGKELAYALNLKNGDETAPPAIIPVIIEGPPPVAPPDELSQLHFNDYLLYLMT